MLPNVIIPTLALGSADKENNTIKFKSSYNLDDCMTVADAYLRTLSPAKIVERYHDYLINKLEGNPNFYRAMLETYCSDKDED